MTLGMSGWQPILLPEVGAEGQTIRVSTWLTQIGEEVLEGDAVVEVLLKGITFDVAAPSSGRLRRIDFFENDAVEPDDVLGWIETNSRPDSAGDQSE